MFGDAPAAGEDQVVPGDFREGLAGFRSAGNHRHFLRRKIFGDQLLGQRAGCGAEFGKFDHYPVAGTKGTDRGVEGEVDREIPWRDHANHALGLILDLTASAQQAKREIHFAFFRAHPFFQMFLVILGMADH